MPNIKYRQCTQELKLKGTVQRDLRLPGVSNQNRNTEIENLVGLSLYTKNPAAKNIPKVVRGMGSVAGRANLQTWVDRWAVDEVGGFEK